MVKRMACIPVPDGVGKAWSGWYFEDGYFCSPQGDRLTSLAVLATVMARQSEVVRDLMYWRPEFNRQDALMHNYLVSPKPSQVIQKDYVIKVPGLSSDDRMPASSG